MKSETTLNLPPFGLKPGRRPALACVLGLVLVFVFALALPTPAFAVNGGTFSDSRWYYQIGGADSVMAPLNARASSATISGSLNLGLGFTQRLQPGVGAGQHAEQRGQEHPGCAGECRRCRHRQRTRPDPAMRISGAVQVVPAIDGLRQRLGHAGLEKLRADAVR